MDYKRNFFDFQESASRASDDDLGGASARSALGNATELRTPPLESPINKGFVDYDTGEYVQLGKISDLDSKNEARRLRFELQDTARSILYGYYPDGAPVNDKGFEVHHRTCSCTLFRNGVTTQIVKSETNGKSFYSGVMSCANSRTCPVCSGKISERKANEMRVAFNMARSQGLCISLLTFTAPHNAGDKLSILKDGINDANIRFWRGAPSERFKHKYDYVGNIRAAEVRIGDKGWHPHFHLIIFSKKPLPVTKRDKFKKMLPEDKQSPEWQWMLSRWKSCCLKAGLNCPNQYGMDIQNGAFAGEYISKFGSDDEFLKTASGKKVTWDMADEMTKGNSKTGREKSRSPWDLLRLSKYAETKEERQENRLLFLEYSRAMYRFTLIKWSRKSKYSDDLSLRDYFGLGVEQTEEEILKAEEDKADFLCHISPAEWEFIIKNKYRSLVLQLAETLPGFDEDNIQIDGSSMAVARFLWSQHNYKYQSFDDFYFEFSNRSKDLDYEVYDMVHWKSTEHKAEVNPFVNKVKKEHVGHLFKKSRPIFEAISQNKKDKNSDINKDVLDFALGLNNLIEKKGKYNV